jgi:hypothetical protein
MAVENKQSQKGIKLVKLTNIPEGLRQYKQWVAWKYKQTDDGKVTKVPVNPHNGSNSLTNVPASWGTFGEAATFYVQHKGDGIAGIGLVFTENDPFCGVDLDDCVNPETSEIEKWAQEVLKDLNSYSEISPSGRGIKIFCKGSLPGSGRKIGNIEMYDTGRYFTVTGWRLEKYPASLEERPNEVNRLYQKLTDSQEKPVIKETKVGSPNSEIDIDALPIVYGTKKLIREGEKQGSRSEAIMSVVDALVGVGISEDAIFEIFEEYPIGEKYREKGSSKKQWLKREIGKASRFMGKPKPVQIQTEASLVFPYHVMSGAAGKFSEV